MLNRSNLPIIHEDNEMPEDFPLIVVEYTQFYQPEIELHVHRCFEIGKCYDGNGFQFISGKIYPFSTNTVSAIQKGAIHDAHILQESPEEKPSYWKYIFADLPAFGISNQIETGFDISSNKVSNLFDLVVELYERKPSGWQEETIHLLHVISKELERLSPDASSIREGAYRDTITVALHRIANEFSTDLSVEELAKDCNMSVSYFRKNFTDIVGVSPLQYIQQVRLNIAEHLIKTTDKKIAEISQEVGFRTLSSFNRLFRQHFGYAPSSLRER